MNEFSCPHCGQNYAPGDDYLAQYGGRETVCTGCKNKFRLPTSSMGQAASGEVATASDLDFSHEVSTDCWAEAFCVVISRGMTLPKRCIRCNADASGRPTRFKIKSYRGGFRVRFGVGKIHTIIRTLATAAENKQYVNLNAYLCARHRRTRTLRRMLAPLLIVLGFLLGVVCPILNTMRLESKGWQDGVLGLVGFLMVVSGAIIRAVGDGLDVAKVENRFAWISGFGPKFSAGLPQRAIPLSSPPSQTPAL